MRQLGVIHASNEFNHFWSNLCISLWFVLIQFANDYLKMNKYCLVWEHNMAVSWTIHSCKCIIIDGYSTIYVFCYTSNILYYVTLTSDNHIKRYIRTIVFPIWRNPNTCVFTFNIIHLHGNATCTVQCRYITGPFFSQIHTIDTHISSA